MEARQQPVDAPDRRVRLDHELRPPLRLAHPAVLAGRRLQRSHGGGAHRDHAPAQLSRQVDPLGREARHPVPLRVRRLARLERGHAGVQHQRRHVDPGGHQLRDQLRRERPPGARHLGASGRVGVHRLVALERPGLRGVGVADRLAVAGQVVRHGGGQLQLCQPEPAARVALEQHGGAAAGQQQHVPLAAAVGSARRRGAARRARHQRRRRARARTGAGAGRARRRGRESRPAASRRC